jgi:hypothetical protein
MRVDFPHIATAETAESSTIMLPQISVHWKGPPSGPGELPISSFPLCVTHLPNCRHRKIALPPEDRATIKHAAPSPTPTQKHLWEQPLAASATIQKHLKRILFPGALHLLILGNI